MSLSELVYQRLKKIADLTPELLRVCAVFYQAAYGIGHLYTPANQMGQVCEEVTTAFWEFQNAERGSQVSGDLLSPAWLEKYGEEIRP